jgi:hypothetical protein
MLTGIRYSLRQIARAPGVSAVIVLTLALGIGTTAGMYSIFHTVLQKPLPGG